MWHLLFAFQGRAISDDAQGIFLYWAQEAIRDARDWVGCVLSLWPTGSHQLLLSSDLIKSTNRCPCNCTDTYWAQEDPHIHPAFLPLLWAVVRRGEYRRGERMRKGHKAKEGRKSAIILETRHKFWYNPALWGPFNTTCTTFHHILLLAWGILISEECLAWCLSCQVAGRQLLLGLLGTPAPKSPHPCYTAGPEQPQRLKGKRRDFWKSFTQPYKHYIKQNHLLRATL